MNGDEIRIALAEKVMGWKLLNYEDDERPASTPEDYADAMNNDGWHWEGNEHQDNAWQWNPLEKPSDSQQLREKLAELGWRRQELKRSWIEPTVYTFVIERREPKHASGYETTIGPYADTEELAVAKAALLTMGVKV